MQCYKKEIDSLINGVFDKFINDISNKYNLSKDELTRMWNGDKIEKEDKGSNDLSKMTKNELVEKCKELGLDIKGKKADLVKRIETNKTNIVHKIQTSITNIVIKKNKFGNYEHSPTKLVFNKTTKTVVGKQMDNGDIIELTESDIDLCNEYKFKFKIPDKLENDESEIDIDEFEDETDESEEEDD